MCFENYRNEYYIYICRKNTEPKQRTHLKQVTSLAKENMVADDAAKHDITHSP